VTPKQKTAIAALLLSAIVAISAMFAPNVKCSPPSQDVIEDALGGESGPAAPAPSPDAGSGESSSSSGSDSAGSSST
jgi:hypothetical protein